MPGQSDILCFAMSSFRSDEYQWKPKLSNHNSLELKTSQKTEQEANMKLNIQTVTQEALFSDLSGEGDMESLFQILVSCKCYMNFKIVCIVIDYT